MSPYEQEISRANKGCILFLIDQSFSMEEPLASSTRRKMDELATALNSWLEDTIIRGTGGVGVKNYFDIGVIGYRTDSDAEPIVESAWTGVLAGRMLVSIAEIAEHPARIDLTTRRLLDWETGGEIEMPVKVRVWLDPEAEGGTPMCNALYHAFETLEGWIDEHPRSYPPIVVNICDGESQDGDPVPYAESLRELGTEDGNVLLFNCHLSMTVADAFVFPASGEILPDELARVLFEMSSLLPESTYHEARRQGIELQTRARGMAFNADMVVLTRFLDLVTLVTKPR